MYSRISECNRGWISYRSAAATTAAIHSLLFFVGSSLVSFTQSLHGKWQLSKSRWHSSRKRQYFCVPEVSSAVLLIFSNAQRIAVLNCASRSSFEGAVKCESSSALERSAIFNAPAFVKLFSRIRLDRE